MKALERLRKWLTPYRVPQHSNIEFEDPIFGHCRYFPSSHQWTTKRQMVGQGDFLLSGRSERPTPQQISLWKETQTRLPELVKVAIESLPKPMTDEPCDLEHIKSSLTLREVWLQPDCEVVMIFDTAAQIMCGNYEIAPVVVYKDWKIISSAWEP
ncbi:MAG: hypothetical protein WCD79_23835 [Chthoniobacteraceae bacterium]